MSLPTLGLFAGLLIAIAIAAGGFGGFLLALVLGGAGYLAGGQIDGRFDLGSLVKNDRE